MFAGATTQWSSEFCSAYICVGSTPSPNAIKFTKDNLRAYSVAENKIYTFDKTNISVEENENSIILKVPPYTAYKLGVLQGNTLYIIGFVASLDNFLTKIISKGTCFSTNEIIDKPQTENRYEVCY